MPAVPARDALRYATDSEMLKLYGVLVGGWMLVAVGESTARTAPGGLTTLVAIVALLVGVVALPSAVVAIAHKLIAES